ncbi:restriction endonuclease S subunit [Mycobacterium sp. JS623]|uniref:restriction endonuclease subunit S n=1 Tax=Mycobacterium sp. JS623 TaxID=212767 RepID=UPI0002A5B339|nr:restriction endonuclease subunit S [Mycobacterium sp. JS623]AGB21657.1 restriction endonuclease S subunit [Mycobacterium sp. JS623]
MTWPVYPRYRSSGVPWLGDVPETWPVMPVKRRFSVTVGKMLNAGATTDQGETVPYLRAGNVQPNGLDLDEVKYIKLTASERRNLDLRKGDLVVVEGGAGYGRSAYLHEELSGWSFQNHILRVRPTSGDSNKFLDFVVRSLNSMGHIASLSNHATIPSLSSEQLSRILIPLPDTATQNAVVDFLDDETAKIDALIAKQEQLIATLREDRTATITHAVTKGLDPNVEMRDTGIEWLGEMPYQWTPLRLKNVIQSAESGTSVNAGDWPADAEEIGVLKTSCVSAGWFNPAANKTVVDSGEIGRVTCPVRADTLIVNRANTPLLVGSAGYVDKEFKNIYLSDKLWQVRFRGALARFIHFWTRTKVYRSQIAAMCVGASSSMQNLAMVDFRNVALALPSLDEQVAIVNHLADRTSTIDELIAKSNEVIEALSEYRSALITDAVTGKIDVREAA